MFIIESLDVLAVTFLTFCVATVGLYRQFMRLLYHIEPQQNLQIPNIQLLQNPQQNHQQDIRPQQNIQAQQKIPP